VKYVWRRALDMLLEYCVLDIELTRQMSWFFDTYNEYTSLHVSCPWIHQLMSRVREYTNLHLSCPWIHHLTCLASV